jgi:malonate transporter and related proteins
MVSVLSITLPIFLLIGLGYAATARGLTTKDNIRGIGVFVLRFALPALIFRALSQRNVGDILDLRYLSVYGLASLAAFASMFIYRRFVEKRSVGISAMSALGVSCSNSGFVGFPVAVMVVGGPAVVALSMSMLIENLVIIPLGLALAESEARRDSRLDEMLFYVFRRLTRNPLVLAIVFGAAASAARLHLPEPLFRAVDLLANASVAAALFAVGGALAGITLKGLGVEVGLIVAAKLCLHPLLVFAGLHLFPGVAPPLAKSMVIFASAPMLSIYPLVAQNFGFERQAAAALLGATVFAFLTMSAVVALL